MTNPLVLADLFGIPGLNTLAVLIVLLLYGIWKIPQLVRGLRESMSEFRRARHEYDDEI